MFVQLPQCLVAIKSSSGKFPTLFQSNNVDIVTLPVPQLIHFLHVVRRHEVSKHRWHKMTPSKKRALANRSETHARSRQERLVFPGIRRVSSIAALFPLRLDYPHD